jgi:hypothetical protein
MTQLLIQTSAPDYTAWKSAFDAEAENIAAASLNTLQIWKGDQNAILVLFEVHNRKNAEAWLAKQSALAHSLTAQFLQTA